MNILIIEDDTLIRDLYSEELKRNGFIVDGVGTGKEGLQKLSQVKYDILLLDIMLPDINGLEILKKIRQNPATKDLKTILLTNLGQDTIIQQGFKLGANKYLIKMSYNPDQVVAEVKDCLKEEQI